MEKNIVKVLEELSYDNPKILEFYVDIVKDLSKKEEYEKNKVKIKAEIKNFNSLKEKVQNNNEKITETLLFLGDDYLIKYNLLDKLSTEYNKRKEKERKFNEKIHLAYNSTKDIINKNENFDSTLECKILQLKLSYYMKRYSTNKKIIKLSKIIKINSTSEKHIELLIEMQKQLKAIINLIRSVDKQNNDLIVKNAMAKPIPDKKERPIKRNYKLEKERITMFYNYFDENTIKVYNTFINSNSKHTTINDFYEENKFVYLDLNKVSNNFHYLKTKRIKEFKIWVDEILKTNPMLSEAEIEICIYKVNFIDNLLNKATKKLEENKKYNNDQKYDEILKVGSYIENYNQLISEKEIINKKLELKLIVDAIEVNNYDLPSIIEYIYNKIAIINKDFIITKENLEILKEIIRLLQQGNVSEENILEYVSKINKQIFIALDDNYDYIKNNVNLINSNLDFVTNFYNMLPFHDSKLVNVMINKIQTPNNSSEEKTQLLVAKNNIHKVINNYKILKNSIYTKDENLLFPSPILIDKLYQIDNIQGNSVVTEEKIKNIINSFKAKNIPLSYNNINNAIYMQHLINYILIKENHKIKVKEEQKEKK